MATVFILPGAFGLHALMPFMLGGAITTGNTVVDVIYDNLGVFEYNVVSGVEALDDLLNSTAGEKIVFGHSLGAVVGSRWLHDYGPTSSIPDADLSFVFIGNPARRYGGMFSVPEYSTVDNLGNDWLIDPIMAPTDTPYAVTDITRQYDGAGDVPNVPTSQQWLLAVTNAMQGWVLIHAFYQGVSLDDSANVTYIEDNYTYIWNPTLPWWEPPWLLPSIEMAYNRPVDIPTPGVPSGPPPPDPKLTALNERLMHGDLITQAEAADTIAETKDFYKKDWIVTVYDKLWRPTNEVGDDLMELTGTDPRNNLPTATLKVKGESPLVPVFMGCEKTMVGVTVETGGLRFPFYVKNFDYEWEDNAWVGTAHLSGIWDILNYLVIWPNFLLPIQAQIPSHAVFIWSLCTVIESMVAECAYRIQSGLHEFINNALSLNPDIAAWFGTLLQSNGNIFQMLKTPIYVVRTNPFLDTSPQYARTVRMEKCGDVITDITRAYGVDVRVDLWLPGDDQPDQWSFLNQPTYVVTAKDRMQIEGPTKTVLDSVIGNVVNVGGSFFGEIPNVINQVPGMEGVFFSPLLGEKYVPPWAVLVAPEKGQPGSIETCKLSFHTPEGWQHIIGGRSPKWLNDIMNATYAWIIDSISILIGFTGIPSNLLEGFLNNAFLAFQLIQDYNRRNDVGPYHPAMERFYPTASSPYNIETLFAFVNALWDSRGYVSAMVTFRNGKVLTLGKDVFRGGLVSVLYMNRTRLFTNYVENTVFRLTTTEQDVILQIGDGKAEEAPLAKYQRYLTGIIESFSVLTLSPQS